MAAAVAAAGAGEPLSPDELFPKAEGEKAEEELEEDDDDEVLGPAGSGAGAGLRRREPGGRLLRAAEKGRALGPASPVLPPLRQ